ncbi:MULTISPECIES: DUF3307 domain-containing protein [Pseudoalteromonas]|uniref:DUF3307 domain-containing protein n=1 Tax=Pseudoalteromonas agarivorans TaxID=176102 RepID=A0AAD0TXG2_9GAMM|nr:MULTISPECIES: DUF3307 domain-containing protein [Pseudoalteromonas]MDY6889458.1 DUF3307 domain-containing protein [Pseudomonadota bacterium]AYM86269.1 DUF3307 domain-containing protein [Pseudoalteromonas agarivorans]KPW00181.1 hypothetical protein AN390_03019 [Pseudoalteromonas sp. P1-11]MDI3246775.1 DUF3307 domain-containing protein [Pseudoalteromonas agarivorans]WRU74219.1 DUF3307 domain-containing protein [Pseudoalteromonas sp. CuT 4-3]|tara:strand:+ start:8001 stop:8744 length:744 start_codon:yes stop_codon:yes gene_type:complete
MGFSLLLVTLIIGHLVSDFFLQPMSWVNDRNTHHFKAKKLYLHVLVHGVVSAVILALWEYSYGWQQLSTVLLSTAAIMLSHYLIDIAKSYSNKGVVPFLLDQIAHIAVIIALCIYITDNQSLIAYVSALATNPKVLWVVCGYLIILSPSAVFIRMMLERLTANFSSEGSLPLAGQSIGMIERVLMLSFILLDQFAGLGFLLAAKSVFRFGDLSASKDKKLTEYVMLGTLLSVSVTLFVGLGVNSLIR